MPGYLDKIKRLHQIDRSAEPCGPNHGSTVTDIELSGKANQGMEDVGSPKFHLEYEINEINELRSAILARLRAGQTWLSDQHQRWLAGDTDATDDEAFSKAWVGWWELDSRLRAEYGLEGCIYGASEECPGDFGCIGCVDVPDPAVVAQLVLAGVSA